MSLLEYEIKCLLDWASGRKAKPSRIQIEPTLKCNLKCVYCGRHLKKFDYSKEIPDKKWDPIAKSVVDIGFKSVILSGEGEVFSEPERTLRLIEYFKKNGVDGSIITNGTLLNKGIIKTLVQLKWDDLVISVDGSNAEIHDKLSGVKGTFKKVLDNLITINEYKRTYESRLPEVCFITVVTNKNYKDFPNIIKLAHKVGCWKITFMPLFNSSNIPSHKDLKINNNQIQELVNIMDEVKELAREYNIQTNADHLLERTKEDVKCAAAQKNKKESACKKDEYIQETEKKPWEPCYQPWLTMTLGADGTCRACCFLHNITDSVKDKTLKEVWYGPVFNKLREDIYKKDSVPGCECCAEPVILRNKEIESELKRLKKFPLKIEEHTNEPKD